ncbi:hypothetical protein T484DRAFT_1881010 [Baffinella frigidus]|nr:hypothetical protein T484DRAFT_1881010 [Cryptophyta sp. CCMP2293]
MSSLFHTVQGRGGPSPVLLPRATTASPTFLASSGAAGWRDARRISLGTGESPQGRETWVDARRSDRLDMNALRVTKSEALQKTIASSALSLFASKRGRKMIMSAMEDHVGGEMPFLEDLKEREETRRRPDAVARPFYWSHAPEPSIYLHALPSHRRTSDRKPSQGESAGAGARGGALRTATANRGYRATPFASGQTPAASQASGAPNVRVPTLGARAHSNHRVAADVILLDGQSFLPGNSGTMTSFY